MRTDEVRLSCIKYVFLISVLMHMGSYNLLIETGDSSTSQSDDSDSQSGGGSIAGIAVGIVVALIVIIIIITVILII